MLPTFMMCYNHNNYDHNYNHHYNQDYIHNNYNHNYNHQRGSVCAGMVRIQGNSVHLMDDSAGW